MDYKHLFILLEKVNTGDLLKHTAKLVQHLARQQLLAVIQLRLLKTGQPLYVKNNHLFYYEDDQCQSIAVAPDGIGVFIQEFKDGFRSLTKQELPIVSITPTASVQHKIRLVYSPVAIYSQPTSVYLAGSFNEWLSAEEGIIYPQNNRGGG